MTVHVSQGHCFATKWTFWWLLHHLTFWWLLAPHGQPSHHLKFRNRERVDSVTYYGVDPFPTNESPGNSPECQLSACNGLNTGLIYIATHEVNWLSMLSFPSPWRAEPSNGFMEAFHANSQPPLVASTAPQNNLILVVKFNNRASNDNKSTGQL